MRSLVVRVETYPNRILGNDQEEMITDQVVIKEAHNQGELIGTTTRIVNPIKEISLTAIVIIVARKAT